MDASLSVSNTISKQTVLEKTDLSSVYFDELNSRTPDSISTERVEKNNTLLGTYTVTSDAISGGMGSVWRVHHNGWNTDLAMKRPQPRFFAEGSEKRKEQFVRECENWINLGLHPNIVSCYYVREIGGVPTIFSEWMDNGSLADRIKDGSLYEGTEDEVQKRILDIAIQAARGLQYSHENGLIHQDFKPGNLLLTKNWDAKVADFGLAKAKSNLNDNSDTAKTTGYTLAYCPQEQVDKKEPARWMDVYAWVLTVFEMYAGKRLWNTGAEAKEFFDEYLSQCRVTMPEKLPELLKACLSIRSDEKPIFETAERTLLLIYRNMAEKDYPIEKASAAGDTADSLNNRALSFLDLGFPVRAEELLHDAVRERNDAENAVFNYALLRWRRGEITDAECLSFLRGHLGNDHPLIAGFLKERGFDGDFEQTSGIEADSFHGLGDSDGHQQIKEDFDIDVDRIVRSNHPRYVGVKSRFSGQNSYPRMRDGDEAFFVLDRDQKVWINDRKDFVLRVLRGDYDYFTVTDDAFILSSSEEGITALYPIKSGFSYKSIMEENTRYLTDDSKRVVKITLKEDDDHERSTVIGAVYESAGHAAEDKPLSRFEYQIDERVFDWFLADGKLFADCDDSIVSFDIKTRQKREVYHSEDKPYCQACVGGRMYYASYFGSRALSVFDTASGQMSVLYDGFGYGSLGATEDGSYVIGFVDKHIKIVDTRLKRCIVDWYEDRFEEWENVVIVSDRPDRFTLHVQNKVFEYSYNGTKENYTYHYDYLEETYPIPTRGEPCGWQLSKIESVSERQQENRKFEQLLKRIKRAWENGDDQTAFRLLEGGYRIKGYEQNAGLRELNRMIGQGRRVAGVRYLQKAADTDYLQNNEQRLCLVGAYGLLTLQKDEKAEKTAYRLLNWNSGKEVCSYSAENDTAFCGVSRDETLAVAIEKADAKSFTLHKMYLRNGKSERITVPISVDRQQIAAAADGKRIVIETSAHTVLIDGEKEPRIIKKDAKAYRLYRGAFSADGKTFAGIYGDRYSGRVLRIYRADRLFAGGNCESEAEYGISDGLDVNQDGCILDRSAAIMLSFDSDGTPMRLSRYEGDRCYAASFIPDGAGFVSAGADGVLSLYLPQSDADYQEAESGTDARRGIVADRIRRYLTIRCSEKIHGASAIAVGDGMCFNFDGTVLLDADGNIWVVDYRFRDEKRKPFHKPSFFKRIRSNEYDAGKGRAVKAKKSQLLALIVAVLSLAAIALGIYLPISARDMEDDLQAWETIKNAGCEVQAVATVERKDGLREDHFDVTYEVDGKTYSDEYKVNYTAGEEEKWNEVGDSMKKNDGQYIFTVYYDPADPSKYANPDKMYMTQSKLKWRKYGYWLSIVGAIVLIIFIYYWKKDRWKAFF